MSIVEIEYGLFDPACKITDINILSTDNSFCAGKAVRYDYVIKFDNGFSFPVILTVSKMHHKMPVFVFPSFSQYVPDKYLPIEEIIDEGFSVASFYYEDVSSDDNDFSSGIAAYYPDLRAHVYGPGKIAIWAWGARMVASSLNNFDSIIDLNALCVVGHSRLGKTALLAGALDNRFKFVISNDSGCGGAALHKNKNGEKIDDITRVFPFWFTPGFKEYANHEELLPFDQDELLRMIVPRNLYIASARDDLWADPDSEYMAYLKVSPYFKENNCATGYHIRNGSHYLSREDWMHFVRFIRSNI